MYVFWDAKRKMAHQQVRQLPLDVEVKTDVNPDPELRETGWYELVDELPSDFIERFPALLGPAQIAYDESDGRMHKRYLTPDFSPPAIRNELVRQMKLSARFHLGQSDWVVLRALETGLPIPREHREERGRLRDLTRWYEAQISMLPVNELPDYSWTFQPPDASAPHTHPVDLPPGVVVVSEGLSPHPGGGERLARAGGPEVPETPLPPGVELGPVELGPVEAEPLGKPGIVEEGEDRRL